MSFAARSSRTCWTHSLAGLALCALLVAAPAALARINLVTLPSRDTVQLPIYNSADLTLVKETRILTFRKRLNRLEFSWANTLADPTSVEVRALTQADAVDVLDEESARGLDTGIWACMSRQGWLAWTCFANN